MAVTCTASDVDDRVQEKLLEYYQEILARDSPTEQWYLLTQIGPALRKIDLEPHIFDFTIFCNSRVRDLYWELWKVLAPIYHNNGCKSYPYQPLGQYEIRLISLIEQDGRKLVCRLDTYPRWLAPEYDALSYTWGNPTDTTIIICNGIELSIGTALHVALRHLLEGAVRPLRPLWIDAVCLNQQDDDEKAHQIPSMGNIYKLATRTLIWLGEATHESDEAMEFLRDLHQKTQIGEHTQEEEARLNSLETDQNGRRLIESIMALLQRSWFSRLWTMQEAGLSQNCQLVCGGKSLEWSAIHTFETTVKKMQSDYFSQRVIGPMFLFGWKEILITLVTLRSWSAAVREDKISDVRALFVLSESKKCKEAVDRIWAILALFPNSLQQRVREAGIVDYSASSKKQYWKTYLSFLKLFYPENSNVLWEIIRYGQGLAKNLNLPSWCPDFNATRQYNYKYYIGEGCRAGFPDANSSITPTILLGPESGCLTVKGFTFDTVQSVTQNVFPILTITEGLEVIEAERKAFRDWLQETFRLVHETLGLSGEAVVSLCETLELGVEQETMSTAAWQLDDERFELSVKMAVLQETLSLSKEFVESFCEKFELGVTQETMSTAKSRLNHELFVQSVGLAYYHEASPWGLSDHVHEVVLRGIAGRINRFFFRGRTFITTMQGRIGFGTPDMRSGDMVCIVEGAEPVFVLRRVDHDTVRSSGVHKPSHATLLEDAADDDEAGLSEATPTTRKKAPTKQALLDGTMKATKPDSGLGPATKPNIGSIFNTAKGGKATTKRTRSDVADELEEEDQPQTKKSRETERKDKQKEYGHVYTAYKDDVDRHPELFSLVGDAHIEGCMHGEAFTASNRGPDRHFTLV